MAKLISFPRYSHDGRRHLEINGTTWSWWVKQLLPLTYRGYYTPQADGIERFQVFRMWLGRPFDIETVKVQS